MEIPLHQIPSIRQNRKKSQVYVIGIIRSGLVGWHLGQGQGLHPMGGISRLIAD